MKSLKMKLIYRKHKKAILGTLGAVLLAGLVFFFSYFHFRVAIFGLSVFVVPLPCRQSSFCFFDVNSSAVTKPI